MQRITQFVASIPRTHLFFKQVRHHSAPKPLAGAASVAGTKRRFELINEHHNNNNNNNTNNNAAHHHGHHHSATRQVHPALSAEHLRPWSMGWTASHVGFGAYRAHDHSHYHALMRALELGCNVIDTSANYSDGGSEHVIGDVVHEMTRHLKVVQRDELIVISKFGYVQNSNLQWARDQESKGKAFPDMVKLSEQMWYCLAAPWIEQQLTQTLARLNLETLDVYLLHNPEHYLRPDTSLQMWEAALEQAFAALEKEVARGRIQFYGVSSNVWSRDQLDLDRLLNIAKKVNGNEHHFRVIQFPLNLLEHDALQSTNGQLSLVDRAKQANLVTLSNRPLNALVEGQLARLVIPEIQPAGKDLSAELGAAFEAALKLEQEYTTSPAYHVPDAQITVAHTLHKHLAYFDLYKFESFIRDSVAPHLNHVLGDDGKLPQSSEFKTWLQHYQRALERLWSTLFTVLALHRHQQASHVYRAVIQTPAFASRAPQLHSLSLVATNAVLSTPVDCMLIGMRNEHYVEDVFNQHLTAPLTKNTSELLEAMKVADEAAKFAHENMKLELTQTRK